MTVRPPVCGRLRLYCLAPFVLSGPTAGRAEPRGPPGRQNIPGELIPGAPSPGFGGWNLRTQALSSPVTKLGGNNAEVVGYPKDSRHTIGAHARHVFVTLAIHDPFQGHMTAFYDDSDRLLHA